MLYGCSPATFKGRREWMRFQSAQSDLGFRAHSRREVSGNFTAIGGFTLLLTAYAVLVWERSCEEFEHGVAEPDQASGANPNDQHSHRDADTHRSAKRHHDIVEQTVS